MSLKIGEFAQITNVSKRMLRHYDKLGLLKPETVDESTGYRLYVEDQKTTIATISLLQSFGFTLIEIKTMLNHQPSPEDFLESLKLQEAKMRQIKDDYISYTLNLAHVIEYLDQAVNMSGQEPILPIERLSDLPPFNQERNLPMSQIQPAQLPDISAFRTLTNQLPSPSYYDELLIQNIGQKEDTAYFLTFDIDRFAYVNEVYGYDFGDMIIYTNIGLYLEAFNDLLELGQAIACRYGGDELSFYIKNIERALLLDRIQDILNRISQKRYDQYGCSETITVTCGIYAFHSASHPHEPRTQSVKAMLEAKKTGRNRYHMIEQSK